MIEPHEAAVVREIFNAYVSHDSVIGVIGTLDARGRTTKRHESAAGRVLGARSWTKDRVLRILKNCTYAGFVRAGDKLVAGQHEAIVDQRTFDLVQDLFGKRRNGV